MTRRGPDVAFHPPFLIVALAVTGWMLWREEPLPFLPDVLARPLGGLLGVISIGLSGWAVVTLVRAGTNVPTHLPAKALVRHGPYRRSRNPIYLAVAIAFAAVAAWLNSAWFVLMAVLFVSLITAGVIVREERYLARTFGREYETYRASVRRWLAVLLVLGVGLAASPAAARAQVEGELRADPPREAIREMPPPLLVNGEPVGGPRMRLGARYEVELVTNPEGLLPHRAEIVDHVDTTGGPAGTMSETVATRLEYRYGE